MPVSKFRILRYLLIIAASMAAALLFPVLEETESNPDPALWILAILIAFLIDRAMERKRALMASVEIELSRMRRLSHLVHGLGASQWREKLESSISFYHKKVAADFFDYKNALTDFRKITHLIYKFEPQNGREEILWEELLQTTRDLALERQNIKEHLARRLSWYSWLIVATIAFFVAILLLLGRSDILASRLTAGLGIGSLLLALDLLALVNKTSKIELLELQKMYEDNLSSMERK
ncbi:hypothetical protein HYT45_03755 [Candidatus Uhrbacteria bacterium]|nr:hypothetical protein [Candidatus Uhrbacteria bacterium]